MKDCVFCNIPDEKKVYLGKYFFVIKDLNPVSEGHSLVISKEHFGTVFDLPSSYGEELIKIVQKIGKELIDKGLADGIKIVQNNYKSSGQVVKHFHMHIIPEKNNVKREKHV